MVYAPENGYGSYGQFEFMDAPILSAFDDPELGFLEFDEPMAAPELGLMEFADPFAAPTADPLGGLMEFADPLAAPILPGVDPLDGMFEFDQPLEAAPPDGALEFGSWWDYVPDMKTIQQGAVTAGQVAIVASKIASLFEFGGGPIPSPATISEATRLLTGSAPAGAPAPTPAEREQAVTLAAEVAGASAKKDIAQKASGAKPVPAGGIQGFIASPAGLGAIGLALFMMMRR